jgi:hypothetical protein
MGTEIIRPAELKRNVFPLHTTVCLLSFKGDADFWLWDKESRANKNTIRALEGVHLKGGDGRDAHVFIEADRTVVFPIALRSDLEDETVAILDGAQFTRITQRCLVSTGAELGGLGIIERSNKATASAATTGKPRGGESRINATANRNGNIQIVSMRHSLEKKNNKKQEQEQEQEQEQ